MNISIYYHLKVKNENIYRNQFLYSLPLEGREGSALHIPSRYNENYRSFSKTNGLHRRLV